MEIVMEFGQYEPIEIVVGDDSSQEAYADATMEIGTVPEALPEYSGEIDITPSATTNYVLDTCNKIVRNNINIQKIPYAEVSNIAGGYTVSIAS